MNRPIHISRTGLTFICLLAAVWIASAWWSVKWTSESIEFGIGSGQAWVYLRQPLWPPTMVGWSVEPTSEGFRWFVWPSAVYFRCLFVPLWLLPLTMPAAMLYRDRVRRCGRARGAAPARGWRHVKACAAGLAIGAGAMWYLSLGRSIAWVHGAPGHCAIVQNGCVGYAWAREPSQLAPGLRLDMAANSYESWVETHLWKDRAVLVVHFATIVVFFGLLAGGACVMQRRAERRAKKDACAGCGYSRAGILPNAACPECGMKG